LLSEEPTEEKSHAVESAKAATGNMAPAKRAIAIEVFFMVISNCSVFENSPAFGVV